MERIILEMENVSGKSGRFRLQNISFALPAGYMMGLVGKNGAGKTTCLNYVMGEKRCYRGNIRIDGSDHYSRGTAFRNRIGFVSEDNPFLEERTGRQNADLLGDFYDDFDGELFAAMMRRMEVSADKRYGSMSRGERMKFQMAFAMAHRPCLYLLDEVTAGMDPVFCIDFFTLLHELIESEACSVLMTSHIEADMKRQMDYIGILDGGRMVRFGENEDSFWEAQDGKNEGCKEAGTTAQAGADAGNLL